MFEFLLPDIGEGISEALLISWTVKVGDKVGEGDEIATISTDKVDVELPAPRAGTVAEVCWKPGDTIPVGEVLVRIDDGGKGKKSKAKAKSKAEAKTSAKAAPAVKPAGPVVAAPSARKLAAELDVNLQDVSASGADGRILRRDIEAAARPAGTPVMASGEVAREGLNGPRLIAYERLSKSVHTLAHSTMSFEARADGLQDLRAKLKPAAEAKGVKLTPAALFAMCAARALKDHPRFNATIDEDARELLLHADVNLSIAVAAEAGLMVPVVAGVDRMPLFGVAQAISDVARKGRDGGLQPGDMRGGTFTLSNTGNLETATILSTRPIINPPQTAILWVSRISDRVRAVEGEVSVGPMVACSLSFDHRFIDGADATRFINDLAFYLECPEAAMASA